MPGLYPGLCPAFSGRSAAGNGRRAFSAPQPWGGNLLFLYRAEYVLFRQARLHAMAWRFREKKDDVKRKSPYDVSS